MKKFSLIFSLLLISLCLSSTAFAATQGADSFRLGGEGRTVQSYPVYVLPNGNLIISLYTQGGVGGVPLSATGHYQTCLLCVNPQNEILWSRTFEGTTIPNDAIVYSVCRINQADNDGLTILLQQHTQEDGAYFLPVTLDADTGDIRETGEHIPYSISDDQADCYISTFCLANVYVQVITDGFSGANSTRTVCAYDYMSHLIWEQPIESLGMSNVNHCLEASSGVLLVGSVFIPDEDGGINSCTAAAMVTPTGGLSWTSVFTQKPSSNINAILTQDGQLMWFGSLTSHPNSVKEEDWQYLACMEPASGVVIWEKTTPFTAEAPLPTGTVLTETALSTDSGYLLTGQNNGNTLFETIDFLGNAIQSWSVPDESDSQSWLLLQVFFRQEALWIARYGITSRHNFMQYDKVEMSAVSTSDVGDHSR